MSTPTKEEQAQARAEAIKVAIREERDQGTPKEDLINMTVMPNNLIEEVYSE